MDILMIMYVWCRKLCKKVDIPYFDDIEEPVMEQLESPKEKKKRHKQELWDVS